MDAEAGPSTVDVALLGPEPPAVYSVLENETAISLHLLAWQCTFLVLIYVFIFPFFDFIPWFGQAKTVSEFSDRVCTCGCALAWRASLGAVVPCCHPFLSCPGVFPLVTLRVCICHMP